MVRDKEQTNRPIATVETDWTRADPSRLQHNVPPNRMIGHDRVVFKTNRPVSA